ncbi:hypothetical protein ABT272_43440 [Streptomyces sp900105245]|uniref:Uncharacterized protein n=1 Tax=Streptomyces sp. 900105245 TaxID=3154379 RepID=A0ABV1UL26_9ACTN
MLGAALAPGLARRTEGLRSAGPVSRPKLSGALFAVLEQDLQKGPVAQGWPDQTWTLARIKTLIGCRFHPAELSYELFSDSNFEGGFAAFSGAGEDFNLTQLPGIANMGGKVSSSPFSVK